MINHVWLDLLLLISILLNLISIPGLELVKQNRFTKISKCSKEEDPQQAKSFLDLQNHFMKSAKSYNKVLWSNFVKFCKWNFLCFYLCNKIMSKDFQKHTKSNLEITRKQTFLSQQFFLSSFLQSLHTFCGNWRRMKMKLQFAWNLLILFSKQSLQI